MIAAEPGHTRERTVIARVSSPGESCADNESAAETKYPLTPAQYFLWSLLGREDTYDWFRRFGVLNVGAARIVGGDLDLGRFEAALGTVLTANPTFCARLHKDGGIPVQTFPPRLPPLEVIEAGFPSSASGALHELIASLLAPPYDYWDGSSLCRTVLIRLSDDVAVFVLGHSHMIADGFSLSLLFDELAAAYNGTAGADAWDNRRSQFLAHLRWLQSPERVAQAKALTEKWEGWLKGVPPGGVTFPLQRPRPSGADLSLQMTNARYRSSVASTLLEELGQRAIRMRVTPFSVVASAVLHVLGRLSGCAHPVVTTVDLGRWKSGMRSMCGFFAFPLPISIEIRHEEPVIAASRRVFHVLDAIARQPSAPWQIASDFPGLPPIQSFRFAHVNINFRPKGSMRPEPVRMHSHEPSHLAAGAIELARLPALEAETSGVHASVPHDYSLNVQTFKGMDVATWDFNSRIADECEVQRIDRAVWKVVAATMNAPQESIGSILADI